MEDNFSTDGEVGGGGNGSGDNATDGEGWGAADEASLACSLARLPAAHFLLCDLVSNRPRTPVFHEVSSEPHPSHLQNGNSILLAPNHVGLL